MRTALGPPVPTRMEDSVPLVNAMSSKTSLRFCQSSTSAIGGGCHWSGWPRGVSQMATIRSAPRYGNGRYSSALITLKMVLFAPMPSASEATTTETKPGFLDRLRTAYLRSCIKVCKKKKFGIFPPPIKPTCTLRPGFTRLDDGALDWDARDVRPSGGPSPLESCNGAHSREIDRLDLPAHTFLGTFLSAIAWRAITWRVTSPSGGLIGGPRVTLRSRKVSNCGVDRLRIAGRARVLV